MTRATLVSIAALLVACSGVTQREVQIGSAAQLRRFGALGSCQPSGERVVLDPAAPLIVLVHGCNASQGRFRSLSEIFELHGQQTLCFRYDDRRRIHEVGRELASALGQMTHELSSPVFTLLGHSQGGLVARAAAVELARRPLATRNAEAAQLHLVTVSAPFNGIRAAADCGTTWLHVLSLGTTLGVCRAIAGAKWRDIHPRALLVRSPRGLPAQVVSHLEIRTDERNSCRRHSADGRCARTDFVFSVAEQQNLLIERDPRVRAALVRAGHSQIVGTDDAPPRQLLGLLQRYQVLRPTPGDRRIALAALLERLF